MTILTVFLGIIVALLVLFGISYYLNMKSIGGLMDLKTTIDPITNDKISKPGSPNYYYAVWVYVNTWDTNPKTLFTYDNQSLVLDTNTPNLMFNYMVDSVATQISNIITPSFPIQKWTHVGISKTGSVLDFYLDGKLIKSYQQSLTITNPSPTASITFGNQTGAKNDIFLAKFQRSSDALDPRSAWMLYLNGPGTGVPMGSDYNYNLKMSVIKDDIVQKTYSLY